jgi:hypothetical protein
MEVKKQAFVTKIQAQNEKLKQVQGKINASKAKMDSYSAEIDRRMRIQKELEDLRKERQEKDRLRETMSGGKVRGSKVSRKAKSRKVSRSRKVLRKA